MSTYMFPGQGSQKKGMGAALFEAYPDLEGSASDVLGYSVKALCLEDSEQRLGQTQYTQPAIYVVNAMHYRHKLNEGGQLPDFVIGHSLGEYNALHAVGAFSFEEGLALVKKRGELMAEAEKGAMAAVIGPRPQQVQQVLEQYNADVIDIANYNSPLQTVIAGPRESIVALEPIFDLIDASYTVLNTSGAFHSRYMAEAKVKFEHYLDDYSFSSIQIPVLANTNALPYKAGNIKENLVEQIVQPVRWTKSIRRLLELGETEFFELGEGKVLTKFVKAIKRDMQHNQELRTEEQLENTSMA